MRIVIFAVIIALATSSANAATRCPAPGGRSASGGKVAYCKLSSLGDDHARIRIVVTTTAREAREVSVPIAIPDGFVVTGLSVVMTGEEAVLAKPRLAAVARESYERVVRQLVDPALLEWKGDGYALLRVFPVTQRSSATVTLELATRATEIGPRLDRQTSLVALPRSFDPDPESTPSDRYGGYWPEHVVERELALAQLDATPLR